MDLLKDEKGRWSSARALLASEMIYLWWSGPGIAWSGDLIALHSVLVVGLLAWAAGPRGLEYLGPQLTSLGGAIVRRVRGTDNARADDER